MSFGPADTYLILTKQPWEIAMDSDVLFWTFLSGLCFALNACCIFLLLGPPRPIS